MDHQWHYVRDGKSLGPISTPDLRRLLASGELRSDDLVWREGMTEWSSVASMRLLPPDAAAPPAHASHSTTARREQRPRRAAVNRRAVVWSVVGVVAVFTCVGWVMMSRPHTPKRDRAAASNRQAAKTVHAYEREEAPGEPAPAGRPVNEPVRDTPAADSVAPTPGEPASEKPREEAARSGVESPRSEITGNPPPPLSPPSVQPLPAVPAKQTLFQVVEVRRSPTFSIQGLETRQSLHYQVLSQLDLERNAQSRTTKVVQLVTDTRLVAADDSSRASFANALKDLKRQQYTYRLNQRGEVIEFTGHKESRMAIPLDLASSTGFQLTSVIDEDGWKELAELTFVVPREGQQPGEPWKRQMTHDWGALGGWSGITTFVAQPPREQLAQITFTREMKYTAPESDGGGLPFQIRDAAFELQQASGVIEFDIAKQRVRNATENFDVRGKVTAELAGVGVQIELTEQQRIEIRLSEQRLSLQ